jgi:hypothetical protein
LFDIDGNPLPVAMLLDSTYALNPRAYDMGKTRNILTAREDVVAAPGGWGRPTFLWQPSHDDYAAVWAKGKTYLKGGGQSPGKAEMFRACFDLDIFGLRAGGAALFTSFYKRKPEPLRDEYYGDEYY